MPYEDLKELEIFEEMTLEDFFKDIYNRSTEDRNAAMDTFKEFKGMINNPEDLFMNGETPSKYLKIAQESTDNLIKMVGAVQKILDLDKKTSSEGNVGVSADDLLDLLDEKDIGATRFITERIKKEVEEDPESVELTAVPIPKRKVS